MTRGGNSSCLGFEKANFGNLRFTVHGEPRTFTLNPSSEGFSVNDEGSFFLVFVEGERRIVAEFIPALAGGWIDKAGSLFDKRSGSGQSISTTEARAAAGFSARRDATARAIA
jgi:hypothetical protein